LMLAVAVFAVAFIMGRLVATLFRLVRARFYRAMPPRRANVLGFVTIAALLFIVTRDGLFDRVVMIVASPTGTVKPGLFGTLLKAAAWSHLAHRIGRSMRAGVVERETLPGGIPKLR
ncbi:Alpha/beta-hydrolase family N-terminus, partial [Roseovarius litoreus]